MLLAERTQNQHATDAVVSREDELWSEYRRWPEDGATLSALMEHYLPLVTRTVHRMSARFHHRHEAADLLGAGILGLHSAIQRFSEEYGVPFPAYACRRIGGAVLDELRQRDPLTRSQRSRLRRTRQALDDFTSCHERPPTDEELARDLDVPAAEVAATLALDYHTVSLQEEAADGLTYEELIEDAHTPSPLESADRQSTQHALRQAIPKLDVRDQQLLFFRHSQALSITEIAAVFEVTPGRVSQMYSSTIQRLRSLMKL